MNNNQKLKVLKAFLTENGFEYQENRWSRSSKLMVDLYVRKYRIAVHISDDTDEEFFKRTKYNKHPFFIRDNESADYVVEKMQNCIIEEMKKEHRNLENKRKAEEKESEKPKRRRVMIPSAERVTPIRKNNG